MPNSNTTSNRAISSTSPLSTTITLDKLITLLLDSKDAITGKTEQIETLQALDTAIDSYTTTNSYDLATSKRLDTIKECLQMEYTTDTTAILERLSHAIDGLQHTPAQPLPHEQASEQASEQPQSQTTPQTLASLNGFNHYAHNIMADVEQEIQFNKQIGNDTSDSKEKLELMESIVNNITNLQELQAEYEGYKAIHAPSKPIIACNDDNAHISKLNAGGINPQLEQLSDKIDQISAIYDGLKGLCNLLSLIKQSKNKRMAKELAEKGLFDCEVLEDKSENILNQLQADYLNIKNAQGGQA